MTVIENRLAIKDKSSLVRHYFCVIRITVYYENAWINCSAFLGSPQLDLLHSSFQSMTNIQCTYTYMYIVSLTVMRNREMDTV